MRRSIQIGRPDRRRNLYPLLSIEGFFNTIRKQRSLCLDVAHRKNQTLSADFVHFYGLES